MRVVACLTHVYDSLAPRRWHGLNSRASLHERHPHSVDREIVMSDLINAVLGSISGDALQRMAGRLGTSPQQTQSAVAAALPLLLGALGRNAAQPQGAEALQRALRRDHATRDPQSVLASVLGGDGMQDGAAILGHIFGERQQRAVRGLGAATGMDSGSASQLLAMLAPLVMQALGQRQQAQGFNLGALQALLGSGASTGAARPGGGLLEAVLDRDGDGDVDFADLMATGGSLLGQFMKR